MERFALIDERLVEDTLHLRRGLGMPEFKHREPVVSPGESLGVVLRDNEGLWRMYYTAFITRDPAVDLVGCETPLLLAYSNDGINWEKPNFGIVDAPGYQDHPNAIIGPKQKDANGRYLSGYGALAGACVIDATTHPHPCAKSRFTALLCSFPIDSIGGLFIARSDDGVNWTLDSEGPVIVGPTDTFNSILYDPAINRYVCYMRPIIHCGMDRHANRKLARCESADLVHWSIPEVILDTDERDAPGLEVFDEPGMRGARGRNKQFQGMEPFIMNNCYIAFTWFYDAVKGIFTNELIHSSDGIHWQREALREPFIADGRPEGFRGKLIVPSGGEPILVGDEFYMYMSSTIYGHHEVAVADIDGTVKNRRDMFEDNKIYVLMLKRDRWVCYEAGAVEGEMLTRPFNREFGGRLYLNCEIAKDGYIKLEVDDVLGRMIPDYHLDEIPPIVGPVDTTDRLVTFGPGPKTVMKFPPVGPLRFRFRMKKARLYGWTWEK
jgi:hypothetical protein